MLHLHQILWFLKIRMWYVNMLFFPYGATYSWRIKYRTAIEGTGVLTPSHDELETVDKILKNFPKTSDAFVLGGGIDWYNMGTSSANIFTKFLCYYVAFESVAVELFDGAELGINLPQKLTKPERRALAKACILQKHSEMFESDPIKFVEQS